MIALSYPGWLQGAFRTLLGVFYRVGLKTKVRKMVRMVCHPCQAAGTQSDAAYEQHMTGVGPSYQERQRV